jgi:hypothetical protein
VLQECKGYRLKRLKQESLSLYQKNLPTFSYELLKRFVQLFHSLFRFNSHFLYDLLCHFCGSSPQKRTPAHRTTSSFTVGPSSYVESICTLVALLSPSSSSNTPSYQKFPSPPHFRSFTGGRGSFPPIKLGHLFTKFAEFTASQFGSC